MKVQFVLRDLILVLGLLESDESKEVNSSIFYTLFSLLPFSFSISKCEICERDFHDCVLRPEHPELDT